MLPQQIFLVLALAFGVASAPIPEGPLQPVVDGLSAISNATSQSNGTVLDIPGVVSLDDGRDDLKEGGSNNDDDDDDDGNDGDSDDEPDDDDGNDNDGGEDEDDDDDDTGSGDGDDEDDDDGSSGDGGDGEDD